jgi:signal peptidase II
MAERTPSNWKSPIACARFLGVAAVGVAVDLSLKSWAQGTLSPVDDSGDRPVRDVIPGLIRLEWTRNRGAALGFFQGDRLMFLVVSVVAIGFLVHLFNSSRRGQWGYQIVLGMLLAGVLGNLYDRVTLGYVRDMIHILPGWRWPEGIAAHLPGWWSTPEVFPWIFNIADSLLCVGVGLMILHSLIQPRAEKKDIEKTVADGSPG